MRPATFEEREDLLRRADCDLLDFIDKLRWLSRKHKMPQQQLLAVLLRAPRPTDLAVNGVRYGLAEDGIELTPAEAKEAVEGAMCALRNRLRDSGVPENYISDQDSQLLASLKIFAH